MTTILFCIFTTKVQHCFVCFSVIPESGCVCETWGRDSIQKEINNKLEGERKEKFHTLGEHVPEETGSRENSVDGTECCLFCWAPAWSKYLKSASYKICDIWTVLVLDVWTEISDLTGNIAAKVRNFISHFCCCLLQQSIRPLQLTAVFCTFMPNAIL